MGVVELLNSLGVSLSANPTSEPSQQQIGAGLTIAAISIQLFVIIIFVFLAVLFHQRCRRAQVETKTVATILFTLDLGDFETLQGLSPLLRYESFFYIFETTLMLINSVAWNIGNPAGLLPKDYHFYLAPNGSVVEGEKVVDNRSFIAKAIHILTFGILYQRTRQSEELIRLRSRITVSASSS
ncbi:hypothetical protein S40293_09055 [Stachybotrys chartarum IBT 40293]|nr:hypothetical protein S40293_09055 [Stachybotrys chartarum IBT 40293]